MMVTLLLSDIINVTQGEWSDKGEWDSLAWLSVLSIFGIKAYYLFNCYFLRKVNSKRIKAESNQEFQNSPECSDCVIKMESSQELNELDKLFASAIEKWPRWEEQISKVYNQKKQLLEGNE